jgi:predicted aspartyl protease
MNRRNLLTRAAGLAVVAGGALWAREQLFWPAPQLVFGAEGTTAWSAYDPSLGVPTLDVVIDGREVTALVDTGAQVSVLDKAWFQTMPERGHSLFDMPILAHGVGGGAQVGRGASLDLTAAGLSVGKLRAAVMDLGELAAGPLARPLILGRDMLGQGVLEIDGQQRRTRLHEPERFVAGEDLAMTPTRRASGALAVGIEVEGVAATGVIDTGSASLLSLSRPTAARSGLLDGRPQTETRSLVLGGAVDARMVEARTVAFADQLHRRVRVGVFEASRWPNAPEALIGMAAFAGRRAAVDIGGWRLMISRVLDLTIS